MQSIRGRLSILFVTCSMAAILLITLFVNVTINYKFNKYMMETQNKRYERIVAYFQDVYKREGKWTESSGIELMHEAYMGNYCLTLLDANQKSVWGMNPNSIQSKLNLSEMPVKDRGVYNSKRFKIEVNNKVVGYVDIGQYSSVLLSQDDVNFKTSINTSIIVSGILTLFIIVIISLYFSKQFSSPIREVANTSVSLSNGNFDVKSNIDTKIEELDNLKSSINVLAEKLKYQDTLRKRLISDISHEIRTPLNVLQNNLEAMLDGVFPVTTERLNYLNEEVIRFGRLLNNLNALKEFESESIKLNFETIALDELVGDICKEFYLIAQNKGIKLNYALKDEHIYITGDEDKLRQVFINLISNAVKFNREHGEVWVSIYEDDTHAVVEVRDNGIGIMEEDLPFIFERLYRGDKSRHQIEGSGIGLTIVKNILQLHSADISATSGEDGTMFKVWFKSSDK